MYNIGEYLVYKRDVCKVKNIKDESYVLESLDDKTLTITIPTSSNLIRNILDKESCEKLIQSIPTISVINVPDKQLESEYKKLLNSGNLEDLIKVIKTTYLRNENRFLSHKKIGEKDDTYFKKAEKQLYNEFSISLGLSFDDTKKYVIDTIEKLKK